MPEYPWITDFTVSDMADNDKIVTRYMDDREFGDAAFAVLSKSIYESISTEEEFGKD